MHTISRSAQRLLVKKTVEKHLTFSALCAILFGLSGCRKHPGRRYYLGVAQLVARYLGVVEAASSSLVTQTISSVHNRPEGLVWTLDCFLPEILFFIVAVQVLCMAFFFGIKRENQRLSSALAHAVCSPFTYRIATPCLVSIRTGVFCTYGTSITPTKR